MPFAIALRMAGYFVAERRQWQPGCVAEPEKVLQFKSISIEQTQTTQPEG